MVLGLFLLLVATVVVGAALWSQSRSSLERPDLEADPAYLLRMPGADELARVGGDRELTLDGPQTPFAGHIFGTTATSAEVYAFYERELARLGWKREPYVLGRSSVELENREYCTPKALFRLAIKDKDRAFQPAFYRGQTYTTVFDARLEGIEPGPPCPIPPLSPPPSIGR